MRQRILLSVPHMGGSELARVQGAFESNWLSTVGPNIDAFERAIEQRLGIPGVALSSGTAAIHLGLRLLGLRAGDEVFCPTLTFTATCNPVRYLGAEPVFLDSERATWNLDPNVLEDAMRDRDEKGRLPRAVIVVHLYGQCAEMEAIRAVCGRYDVPILEDAAQALGATYRGCEAGTIGEVGVFSFNGNKIITTTGGGMLVSKNREWVDKARFWAQQARDAGIAYEHSELGYNYRMSNVLAGIGLGQLEMLDTRIEQRRAIAFRYRDAFADLPGIEFMPQRSDGIHTNWLSCFLIDEKESGCSRDELIAQLDAANVESRPVWKPMHLQPLYAGCEVFGGAVAEDLFRRGICLPSSSSLSRDDHSYVIDVLRRAWGADRVSRHGRHWIPGDASTDHLEQAARALRNCDANDEGMDEGAASSVHDLIGRRPVLLDEEPIRRRITGRMVMVTGAAGSIGAELCRQIARFGPAAIVGFDIAESGLFELDMQMRRSFPQVPFHAEIGNVQNAARVERLLVRYRPEAIYHAAAYKHVPIMESHVYEAVENNVFGMVSVAAAAAAHGVKDFVQISSDKAVHPTSVMGVTKRIAELALQAMQNGGTKFVAVRFGNVLGSAGSVLPIFKQQIAAGGPVTVTDPEMRRYFMTAEEAAQLVLQAAEVAQAGQICVLEMGQPVRILDLANNLIRRAGLVPGRDIGIEFIGKRPGEKLCEELSSILEEAMETEYENIHILSGPPVDRAGVLQEIERLRDLCKGRGLGELVDAFKELVPEYVPSSEVLRQISGRECELEPDLEFKKV